MDAHSRDLIVNRISTRLQDSEQQDAALLEQGGLARETVKARRRGRRKFLEIVLLLGRGEAEHLNIKCKHMLELLLDNLHDVQQLISGQESKLEVVTIGHSSAIKLGQVSLTMDQEVLWIELLTFLDGLKLEVFRVAVGGVLPMKMVVQALQMVPSSVIVSLEIPYPIQLGSDEYNDVIQAVDNRRRVAVVLVGTGRYSEHFEKFSREGCMGDASLFHSLFQHKGFRFIGFQSVDIMLQDCKWLAVQLLAEKCHVTCLRFSSGTVFLGNGGAIVASAITRNTSLKALYFDSGFHDENFTDDALAKVMKGNYTITEIYRGGVLNGGIAGAIATLNEAGRGYVQTNKNASKRDCVEVLIKVRDNLPALFHLLRNNMIFFGN